MSESNAILLDMDEERELKWSFGAIKTFEKRAKEILKKMDIRNEKGQQIATQPLHAGFILAQFLRISDILEAAVGAACGVSALDIKDKPSEASAAIDGYLSRGGSLGALQQSLYRAYLVANDPSSLSEWEGNLTREQEIKKINREKQEAKIEVARLELAEDVAKIERLKGISGNAPTTSPMQS